MAMNEREGGREERGEEAIKYEKTVKKAFLM